MRKKIAARSDVLAQKKLLNHINLVWVWTLI